ncbi:hypothetical protein C8Q80DRAFT_471140 [Daedaleopsis nitida]|nr:hypothetical protein C8Q80DRAFT_471140 [Daedaleopsis nitida]
MRGRYRHALCKGRWSSLRLWSPVSCLSLSQTLCETKLPFGGLRRRRNSLPRCWRVLVRDQAAVNKVTVTVMRDPLCGCVLKNPNSYHWVAVSCSCDLLLDITSICISLRTPHT